MKVHFEKRKRGTRFSWWCAWKMRCSCMIFHASSNSPRSRDRISIFVFYVHAYNDEAKLGEHTNEHSIADWPFTFVTMYASARSFHGFSMKLESSFSATRERSQKNIVIEKKIGLVNLKFKFLLCLHHERICFIHVFLCWFHRRKNIGQILIIVGSRDGISIFVFYVHAYNDEAKLGEHTNEHSIADWPLAFVTMYASARSLQDWSINVPPLWHVHL